MLTFDFASAESRYRLEPIDPLTPEALFERRWALTILEQTLDRLRQEMAATGKTELYQQLQPILTGAPDAARYAQIANVLNMTEAGVKKAVQRLRERYGEMLREGIAATVENGTQVDEELQALFAALAGGGR